jgi:hypothetical protein
MTRRVEWRKHIEIDFSSEISDTDAQMLDDGNTDVLANYEDDNMGTAYAVTDREVT